MNFFNESLSQCFYHVLMQKQKRGYTHWHLLNVHTQNNSFKLLFPSWLTIALLLCKETSLVLSIWSFVAKLNFYFYFNFVVTNSVGLDYI